MRYTATPDPAPERNPRGRLIRTSLISLWSTKPSGGGDLLLRHASAELLPDGAFRIRDFGVARFSASWRCLKFPCISISMELGPSGRWQIQRWIADQPAGALAGAPS